MLFNSDISDHLPIFVICKQLSYQNSTPKIPKSHRKKSQENIDSLNIDLANDVWLEVFSESDVNKCYNIFIQKLMYYYDKNIPLITIKQDKEIRKMPRLPKEFYTPFILVISCINYLFTNLL